jgi:hypothetical protein
MTIKRSLRLTAAGALAMTGWSALLLLANQSADGSWPEESNQDMRFGRTYTTALVVLALGAPNQFLPIFQR